MMMVCAVSMRVDPSAVCTSMRRSPTNRASPKITSTPAVVSARSLLWRKSLTTGALSRDHSREIDGHVSASNSEVMRALRQVGHASARNHGFRGRAPIIDARAADVPPLDQYGSAASAGKCAGDRTSTLPRSDNDCVHLQIGHGAYSIFGNGQGFACL